MVSYTYNCGTRYWIDDVFRRFQLTPNIIQEGGHGKGDGQCCSLWSGRGPHAQNDRAEHLRCGPLTLENSELHRPMFMCWPKGRPCGQWSKIFGTTLWDRVGRASLLNRSHSTGARCPTYIENRKDAARGESGQRLSAKKRKQKSADQAQRDLWEDHDQNQADGKQYGKGQRDLCDPNHRDLGHGAGDKQIDPNGRSDKANCQVHHHHDAESGPDSPPDGGHDRRQDRREDQEWPGAASITMPTKSRKMLTTSRMRPLAGEGGCDQAPTICGTFIRGQLRVRRRRRRRATKRMGAIVFKELHKNSGDRQRPLMVL